MILIFESASEREGNPKHKEDERRLVSVLSFILVGGNQYDDEGTNEPIESYL